MKKIILIAIAVMLVLSADRATASSSQRTDQLLWECTGLTPKNMPEIGKLSCAKYIDGIMDMHSLAMGFRKMPPMFCSPKTGISIDQAMRIFIKWANENPSQLHQSARTSVAISLIKAFPCK